MEHALLLFFKIIIPLLQSFIKSPSVEGLCPGAEIVGMVLKMEGDRTSEHMFFGLQFGPTAGLQASHAAEDNTHIIRQFTTHFVRHAAVSNHLFIDGLDMSRRIEAYLLTGCETIDGDP